MVLCKISDQITQEIEKRLIHLPENDAELNSVTSDVKDLAELLSVRGRYVSQRIE